MQEHKRVDRPGMKRGN